MYKDMRVKYLFVNLKYPAYVKLQVALVVGWFVAGGVLFFFARDSGIWLLANGWWLCPVIAVAEVAESMAAVAKAKKDYVSSSEGEWMHNNPDAGDSKSRA